jgi:hypothetical protein
MCSEKTGKGRGFFSKYFGLPLSVPLHQFAIFSFIYVLFLPEGQRSQPGNLPKFNALSNMKEH